MHMRVFAFSSLSALAVAVLGCGGNSIPSAPTASVPISGTQATPFPFNAGEGVLIGTEGFVSIVITNIGSQDMDVSSVTYTGDGAITLNPGVSVSTNSMATQPWVVPYNSALVVGLTCSPVVNHPEVQETYNGLVDIKSNAANLPDIQIYLQCVGVPPSTDGGT